MTRALLLAAVLVAGGACVAPTEVTQAPWTVTVEKTTALSQGHESYSEPVVLLEADRVRVTGYVRTAYICDNVSPTVVATARRISIRLVRTPHSGGCVATVGEHTYVVEGTLSPGTYDLTVVVDSRGHTPVSTTMLDTRVRID